MGKLPQSTSIIIQFSSIVKVQLVVLVSFGAYQVHCRLLVSLHSPTNRKSSSQSVVFRRIQRQENEAEVLSILCDDDKYGDAEFAAVVSCCRVVALMMQKENADDAISSASKVDSSIPQNDLLLTSIAR